MGVQHQKYMIIQGGFLGVQHQNIHDKSREGSWGFNTKTYMTSPGRVLGGSTPKYTFQGGFLGGGFNTKIYMTNPGRVLGGSTPKHT